MGKPELKDLMEIHQRVMNKYKNAMIKFYYELKEQEKKKVEGQ